jgi:hypothetical protein
LRDEGSRLFALIDTLIELYLSLPGLVEGLLFHSIVPPHLLISFKVDHHLPGMMAAIPVLLSAGSARPAITRQATKSAISHLEGRANELVRASRWKLPATITTFTTALLYTISRTALTWVCSAALLCLRATRVSIAIALKQASRVAECEASRRIRLKLSKQLERELRAMFLTSTLGSHALLCVFLWPGWWVIAGVCCIRTLWG